MEVILYLSLSISLIDVLKNALILTLQFQPINLIILGAVEDIGETFL